MNLDNRVKIMTVIIGICSLAITAMTYFFPSTIPNWPGRVEQSNNVDSTINAPGNTGTVNQNNIYNNPPVKDPDPNSPEGARLELQRRQLPFTGHGFLSAVVIETSDIVELYLRAGFSPNDYLAGTHVFPLYEAMSNSGDSLAIVNTILKYHPDLNKVNMSQNFARFPPMTMGQEALFEAVSSGRVDIVARLLQVGVNQQFFVEHANSILCDRSGPGAGQVLTMQKAGINIHACGK